MPDRADVEEYWREIFYHVEDSSDVIDYQDIPF
jgi:hypothetical protein